MERVHLGRGFQDTCAKVFFWKERLSLSEKVLLSVFFACFTGLMAQVRFFLPVTPVPFTGQVFAVLLSAALLGRFYGGLSQIIYAGAGFLGVPWFAGGVAASFFSPTAGYVVGFIAAAFFIGWAMEKSKKFRFFFPQAAILVTGVFIIYLFGAVYFMGFTGSGVQKALHLAV